MTTWRTGDAETHEPIGAVGWVLIAVRAPVLAALTYGGLLAMLAVRLIEWPIYGSDRPVTPQITRFVSRAAFVVLGIRYRARGKPMRFRGAVVANHSSWLDIFALNACQTVYFVSKSEVAGWPVIGWLARATGTVFIARNPKEAKAQQALFETRIRAGHKLLFFPEGTSTDGLRVLPFKSTLFAAFYSHGLEHVMQIQPVSIIYSPPAGKQAAFYGWWGDMDFAPHLLKTLSVLRHGAVEVIFHDPVSVDSFASRKELARHCEEVIRQSLTVRRPPCG
ncbi:MAG: lysophospholipid acyltransferase family protein [Paracoccaceae bacterium]